MSADPAIKRAVAFVDGQNLYHSARESFGYNHPNYDVKALAASICQSKGWQNRWLKIASAFPQSPTSHNRRGVNKTDWVPIDKKTYDACLDPRDYRKAFLEEGAR